MTRILLISDTHGYIDEDVLKHVKDADEVWHAGDIGNIEVIDKIQELKPVRAVFGNIDNALIRREFPLHNRFKCEEVDVWITHIGGYPGRYSLAVRNELEQNPPDLFITGHSHILKVMNDKKNKLLHMNPGAIGKQGFHRARTMLRFVINGKSIENLEVIEYKR